MHQIKTRQFKSTCMLIGIWIMSGTAWSAPVITGEGDIQLGDIFDTGRARVEKNNNRKRGCLQGQTK